MKDLKLIALDAEDLGVLSAHLQDAVVRVGDLAYLKREKRFAAIFNRFDWESAAAGVVSSKGEFRRRRSGVRFERVLSARVSGIDLKDKDRALALLAVSYDATDVPRGEITLVFAGGAAIRLDVECIEAELTDLGAVWSTRRKPSHATD